MKKYKTFKEFELHLRNYISLSLLMSLGMLIFSAVFVIFNDISGLVNFEIPIIVHYLGLFISSMMLIMGMYYFRILKNKENKKK